MFYESSSRARQSFYFESYKSAMQNSKPAVVLSEEINAKLRAVTAHLKAENKAPEYNRSFEPAEWIEKS